MSDPLDENIVPPADETVGLTVRCPRPRCNRIMMQAWRDRGEVYMLTASFVARCRPKVTPWVFASCNCMKSLNPIHQIDVAKVRKMTPTKGRRSAPLADVVWS